MSESSKPRALAIVGATASGKSGLALAIAPLLNAEIVCMDSMQIYRGMDIGTAKPAADEQRLVPHHMLDIVDAAEPFSAADYTERAMSVIRDIESRGRLPLLVGGTGLYLKALMHGMALGGAKSDPALREALNAAAREEGGLEKLHAELAKIDPVSAAKFHPNDQRRVIRALEVFRLTGEPISAQRDEEGEGMVDILPIGLSLPREVLRQRIENRVSQMIHNGLLDEVRALLSAGVPPKSQSMQGIGYKELVPVVLGDAPLSDAAWQIILNTRHYAKRQETWFRAEPKIRWLDALSPSLTQKAIRLCAE